MPVDVAVHTARIHKTQNHAFFLIAMVFLALGAGKTENAIIAPRTQPCNGESSKLERLWNQIRRASISTLRAIHNLKRSYTGELRRD
jgi:hypothetical protein